MTLWNQAFSQNRHTREHLIPTHFVRTIILGLAENPHLDRTSTTSGHLVPYNLGSAVYFHVQTSIKDTTESNTSASYLDLLVSIGKDGQLRTSLYDKRDDLNFNITNFPFLSSNIPSSPVYGVFISQLIQYAMACSSFECFILRAARLSCKLLGQGYDRERLKSSIGKFYGR